MMTDVIPAGFVRMTGVESEMIGRALSDAAWLLSLSRDDLQVGDTNGRTEERLTNVLDVLRDMGRRFTEVGKDAIEAVTA